jgi:hypothetical protein
MTRPAALAAALLLGGCGPDAEPADGPACELEEIDLTQALQDVFLGQADACQLEAYEGYVDFAVADARGPWSSEVRAVRSQDGYAFDLDSITVLLPHAGVPELVLHESRYYLFHLDGDPERAKALAREGSDWYTRHGLAPFGGMRLASSLDGERFDEVEDFGIEGLEPSWIADPDVIRLPDGRWRLYFLSIPVEDMLTPGFWEEGTPHSIRYAESDDLVHWQDMGEAAYGPFADPTVICEEDGRCRMYSYGLDHSSSTDGGERFEYHGPHEISGFAPEFHQADGEPLRLFVSSKQYGAPLVSFSYVEGEHWNIDEGERLPLLTAEAASLAPGPDGDWLMVYHMDLGVEAWDDTGLD